MDHADIIEALGGAESLAAQLGRHRSRVYRWRKSGIPCGVWPELVTLARSLPVPAVTWEALAAGQPKPRRAAA